MASPRHLHPAPIPAACLLAATLGAAAALAGPGGAGPDPGTGAEALAAPSAAPRQDRGASRQPRAGRRGNAPGQQARRARSLGQGPGRSQGARSGEADASTDDGARDPRSALGGTSPLADNPFGTPENQVRIWFNTADFDSTDWISFREAAASIGFDAARFRIFDTDNDGRLTFDEYSEFLDRERDAGRNVVIPMRAELVGAPPARDAEQLRAAYDVDLDGAISRLELDRILLDYSSDGRQSDFDAPRVMERFDTSGDGVLELAELDRLTGYIMPGTVLRDLPTRAAPNAKDINSLFAHAEEISPTLPPKIRGPVPPFRRLDVNGDGFVDLADLQRLEGRSFASVRLESILLSFDLDYDEKVSEREFLKALTPSKGR